MYLMQLIWVYNKQYLNIKKKQSLPINGNEYIIVNILHIIAFKSRYTKTFSFNLSK